MQEVLHTDDNALVIPYINAHETKYFMRMSCLHFYQICAPCFIRTPYACHTKCAPWDRSGLPGRLLWCSVGYVGYQLVLAINIIIIVVVVIVVKVLGT